MSAYLMDPTEVGELATAIRPALLTVLGEDVPLGEVARLLAIANAESVGFRYQEHADAVCVEHGGLRRYVVRCQDAARREFGQRPTPERAEELRSCFEYQSCEVPDWMGSRVQLWCEALETRMGLLLRAKQG